MITSQPQIQNTNLTNPCVDIQQVFMCWVGLTVIHSTPHTQLEVEKWIKKTENIEFE